MSTGSSERSSSSSSSSSASETIPITGIPTTVLAGDTRSFVKPDKKTSAPDPHAPPFEAKPRKPAPQSPAPRPPEPQPSTSKRVKPEPSKPPPEIVKPSTAAGPKPKPGRSADLVSVPITRDAPPEEPMEDTHNRAYYIWFLCSVITGSLVIPLGMLLYPLWRLTHAPPTAALHESTTTDYQRGVTKSCFEKPKINDNIEDLFTADIIRPPVIPNYGSPVCCLYNASRFRKEFHFDYLPKHVPFTLCQCLVYWSVGLDGPKIVSRAPKFDQRFGLRHLASLKGTGKVLLTIGGYLEDSIHFSRLSVGDGSMGRLVSNILDTLIDNGLDGVNIHWESLGGTCGSPNDFGTLLLLIDRLRDIFRLNGRAFDITMILPYPTSLNVEELLPRLQFLFYRTHDIGYRDSVLTGCDTNLDVTKKIKSSLLFKYRPKVCYSASVFLWAAEVEGQTDAAGNLQLISHRAWLPLFNVSRTPGKVAMYEICDITTQFERKDITSCYFFVNEGTDIHGVFQAFFYESDEVRKKKERLGMCVLIYDIDFDTYREKCSYGPDWMLSNILLS